MPSRSPYPRSDDVAPDTTDHPGRGEKPSYVAFDLLWLDGIDLRSQPLDERRQRLLDMLPKGSRHVSEALAVQGGGCELFELKNPDYSQQEGRGDLFNPP